ncbi:MAG: MauE/DoxX family redox-associated membrane protein [Thermomicrobiales bacterium]
MLIVAIPAIIFLLSGVLKLTSRGHRDFQKTLIDLRITPTNARLAAFLIPALEIAIAAGLIIEPSRLAFSIGGVAVLVGFSALAISVQRSGRTVSCSCFGNIGQSTLGMGTVYRNAVPILLLVASIVNQTALESRYGHFPSTTMSLLGLSVLVNVVLAIALGVVLREHGGLLYDLGIDGRSRRADLGGLMIGDEAPAIAAPEILSGEATSVPELVSRFPSGGVAMFVSKGCPACSQIIPHLSSWSQQLAGAAGMILVLHQDSPTSEMIELAKSCKNLYIISDESGLVGSSFAIQGTPSAVSVGVDGRIASNYALGPQSVFSLLQTKVS